MTPFVNHLVLLCPLPSTDLSVQRPVRSPHPALIPSSRVTAAAAVVVHQRPPGGAGQIRRRRVAEGRQWQATATFGRT
eukprot:SAG31_NODE_39364_length_288_cov_21.497354_1_plen_77_part_10